MGYVATNSLRGSEAGKMGGSLEFFNQNFNYCGVLIVCLVFSGYLRAQNSVSTGADFIYRETREYKIDDKDDTTYDATVKVKKEFTYLSDRSLELNHIHLQESSVCTISNVSAEFNGSSISDYYITSELPDYEDVFLSTGKAHTIYTPKRTKRGDVFSCRYREYFPDIVFLPVIEIPSIDSVAEFNIVIKHPSEIKVHWEIFFPRDSIPSKINNTEPDETVLSFYNIRYNRNLFYFPFNKSNAMVLLFFEKEGKNISVSTPAEFVDWYGKLTRINPVIDSAHFASVKLHIDSTMTVDMKLDSINAYVRSNIRYIADERMEYAFTPRKCEVVLERKYGDCKDRAALVCALAREYGIRVNMALVSTIPNPQFENFNPLLFNHIICAYRGSDKTIFFDPTQKYLEFGNLPYDICQGTALILDDSNPRSEYIPVPPQMPSLEIKIQIKDSLMDKCAATIVLRNEYAAGARHAVADLTKDKLHLFLQYLISSKLYQIRLDNFELVGDGGKSITFRCDADLNRFFMRSGNRMYFPKTAFKIAENDILDREKDNYPIFLEKPLNAELLLSIDSSHFKAKEEVLKIGLPGDQYNSESKLYVSGKKIHAYYTYKASSKWSVGPEKQKALAFHKEYFKNKKNMFIMTKE